MSPNSRRGSSSAASMSSTASSFTLVDPTSATDILPSWSGAGACVCPFSFHYNDRAPPVFILAELLSREPEKARTGIPDRPSPRIPSEYDDSEITNVPWPQSLTRSDGPVNTSWLISDSTAEFPDVHMVQTVTRNPDVNHPNVNGLAPDNPSEQYLHSITPGIIAVNWTIPASVDHLRRTSYTMEFTLGADEFVRCSVARVDGTVCFDYSLNNSEMHKMVRNPDQSGWREYECHLTQSEASATVTDRAGRIWYVKQDLETGDIEDIRDPDFDL
ncbi:hypothetical protein M231_00382 [Tremella mesenterica]|uniref:Uncharacterized protein n=1 Tax=Tremella mesenterica TaxID=5217 RepID=A0A4Q1BWD1_TREME|nr:hypothetical protein M231_00382 [Tremella mesenterica]